MHTNTRERVLERGIAEGKDTPIQATRVALVIVGMVPTANDQGYFLVGRDGGVFAFGNAPFENSLPGIGVSVNDIVGIVPTSNDQGYFVVGSDGGVFTFGNAPFLGSLPSIGVHVTNIIGIAANPSDTGYWLVAAMARSTRSAPPPTSDRLRNGLSGQRH